MEGFGSERETVRNCIAVKGNTLQKIQYQTQLGANIFILHYLALPSGHTGSCSSAMLGVLQAAPVPCGSVEPCTLHTSQFWVCR